MKWKKYPEYKDSGNNVLGKIPKAWEVKRVKNITRFAYGDSLASDIRRQGHYNVMGSNGIVGTHEKCNTYSPCLIIGRKGSFGKVTYSEHPCFAIDTTYYIDTKQTKENIRWLYYCLLNLNLDSFSKDTAIPGLAREDAYNNLLSYCNINEQYAIAAFLDRETEQIDNLIVKKEHQIELLQEKRSALISQAVTKGLNPNVKMKDSGVNWMPELPVGWTIYPIKRITSIPVTDGPHESPEFLDTGIPFVSAEAIWDGKIHLDAIRGFISVSKHNDYAKNTYLN